MIKMGVCPSLNYLSFEDIHLFKGPWGSLVSFMLGVHVTPVQIWGGPPLFFKSYKKKENSMQINA